MRENTGPERGADIEEHQQAVEPGNEVETKARAKGQLIYTEATDATTFTKCDV